jgi:hypothetical protein
MMHEMSIFLLGEVLIPGEPRILKGMGDDEVFFVNVIMPAAGFIIGCPVY